MKTKEELNGLTLTELQNVCKNNGITGYSRMSKMKLVKTIMDFEAAKASDKKEFSDRNYIPVNKGDVVKVRFSGTNWVEGVVQKMKLVDEADEYFWVLLEGQEKAIMYHSNDIDASSSKTTTQTFKEEEIVKDTTSEEKVEEEKPEQPKPEQPVGEDIIELEKGVKVDIVKSDGTTVQGEVLTLKTNPKGVKFYRLKAEGKVICRIPKYVTKIIEG